MIDAENLRAIIAASPLPASDGLFVKADEGSRLRPPGFEESVTCLPSP